MGEKFWPMYIAISFNKNNRASRMVCAALQGAYLALKAMSYILV